MDDPKDLRVARANFMFHGFLSAVVLSAGIWWHMGSMEIPPVMKVIMALIVIWTLAVWRRYDRLVSDDDI